jgi:hypothetical protein
VTVQSGFVLVVEVLEIQVTRKGLLKKCRYIFRYAETLSLLRVQDGSTSGR